MQESNDPVRPTLQRALPWLVGATALVLYLVTLSPWITVTSLSTLLQVSGWDGQSPVTHPLLYIVTRPLRLLPDSILPIASNFLAALSGAISVGLLARCVALLPQDRTRAQRIRGHADGALLSIRWGWVPQVLAAGVLGFQLTFWEQSTAQTGEMLSLLVIAIAVWTLLEYRVRQSDTWLWAHAFVVGAGMSSNWAMIGFAPAFIGAIAWIDGFKILNVRRILRLVMFWALGTTLYLLMPLVARGTSGLPEGYFASLWGILNSQKNILLGIPKTRFLMLASIMLLPLLGNAIKMASAKGSGLERLTTAILLVILQLLWLGGCIAFAFDPPFSPRQLITIDPGYFGLPLLSFYFAAALAVGYLAGYFILVGTVDPERRWDQSKGGLRLLQRGFAWILIFASVAVPAALLVRNFPAVRAENSSLSSDLSSQWSAALPAEPSMVLCDDPFTYALMLAESKRMSANPGHVIVSARQAADKGYRSRLARQHGEQWAQLQAIADAEVNAAGMFATLVRQLSDHGRAFYLSMPMNFITEIFSLEPSQGVFKMTSYKPGQIGPRTLSSDEASAIDSWWQEQTESINSLKAAIDRKSTTATAISRLWSRSANSQGILLQRSGHLIEAARLFTLATNAAPENFIARANLEINQHLLRDTPLREELHEELVKANLGKLLEVYGPVDEPTTLTLLGERLLQLGDPLVRAAAISFQRALAMQPSRIDAAIGFAEATAAAGETEMTFAAVQRARSLANDTPMAGEQSARLSRIEAATRVGMGEFAQAEKLLVDAHKTNPEDVQSVDLLVHLYLQQGLATNAIPYIDRLAKLRPNDEKILERRGFVLLRAGVADEAVKAFDKVLSIRPSFAGARLNRAAAYLLLAETIKAREDYEWLVERDLHLVRARMGLASVAEIEGNAEEAIHQLQKAIENLPPNAPLRSNLVERIDGLKSLQQ